MALYTYVVGGVRVIKNWEYIGIPLTNYLQYDGPPVAQQKRIPTAPVEVETTSSNEFKVDIVILGDPMFSPGWGLGIYTTMGVSTVLGLLSRGVLGRVPIIKVITTINEALNSIS